MPSTEEFILKGNKLKLLLTKTKFKTMEFQKMNNTNNITKPEFIRHKYELTHQTKSYNVYAQTNEKFIKSASKQFILQVILRAQQSVLPHLQAARI